MNFKGISKNKLICIILTMLLIIGQCFQKPVITVKADTTTDSVQVIVEGNNGIIVSGTSQNTNGYLALKDVLDKNGKTYDISDGSYGKFINSIDGLAGTSDWSKYWLYTVNRDGNYVGGDTSIDGCALNNGDKLIVYYAGSNTMLLNKIDFSTKEANKPVVITLSNTSTNWSTGQLETKPISNITAKIDGNSAALNGNTITLNSGLSAGKHTLEVSDYKSDGTPNVVADSIDFNFTPTVNIRVEGLDKTILDTSATGANVLEAVENALNANHISYVDKGGYLSSINGLNSGTIGAYDGWMYYVKSVNKITSPDVGMQDYIPQDGDYVIVYYSDGSTPFLNKVTFNPDIVKENTSFTMRFGFDHFDWNINKQVDSPIANAVVTIDDLAPVSTDSNGMITLPFGLASGSHRYKISGYNPGNLSAAVMDEGTFTIDGIHAPSFNYSDAAYDSGSKETDNSTIAKDIQNELASTSDFLKGKSDAWIAVSLSKLGIKPDESFIKDSAENLKENGISAFYNTDLEKLIMGLVACGYTPYNFMGYDLVQELFNRDINTFYSNDAIFGLLTYNFADINGSYKITKNDLIQLILKDKLEYNIGQKTIDGWTYYGQNMDPDLTGAAICALSPYEGSDSKIKTEIANSIDSLSYLQNISGYIPSQYGITDESAAFVCLGLSAAGVSSEGPQFTKAKGDLIQALLSFKGTNSEFKHETDGNNDLIATEQSLRALIALKEFKDKGQYNYYLNTIDKSKLNTYVYSDGITNNTENVVRLIDGINIGGTAFVDATGNTAVSKAVFEEIKGQDKNISFIQYDSEGNPKLIWTFNGKDITNPCDINLQTADTPVDIINAINKKVGGYDVLPLTFNYEGTLPGKATVKIRPDSKWLQGKDKNNLYMYYYNPKDDKVEAKYGPSKLDDAGFVSFTLSHCSNYFIADNNLFVDGVLPQTGFMLDTSLLILLGIILIAGGSLLIFIKFRKKSNV